jgi:hypothetical protein
MFLVPAKHVFAPNKLVEIPHIYRHLQRMKERIGNAEVTPAQQSTVLRNTVPLTVVDGDGEKRGPGRPPGYPKTGGRKGGVKNRISADVKQAILVDGRPLELLFQIARGNRMKAGDPSDPTKKVFVYPTLSDRRDAAKTLLAKVVPDLKSQELVGDPSRPLFPAPEATPFEVARKVAFLLASGDPQEPVEPRRAADDDMAAAEFRNAITAAPAAPPPLEPGGPPRSRELGMQYIIGDNVLVQYEGQSVNGLESWAVVRRGTVVSRHEGWEVAAAAARGLT